MTILLIFMYAALLIAEAIALIASVIYKQRFSVFACIVYMIVTIIACIDGIFLK
jgi:hypothetical protein